MNVVEPAANPAPDELSPEAVFLETLGGALHVYGLPSHRLEAALSEMARALDVEAQFLVTPTSIVFSFGPATRLLRIDPGETHLERLTDLHRIMTDVRKERTAVAQATRAIRDVCERGPRYRGVVTIVAFALASGSAALFFGGGWRESVGAAVIGGLIGCFAVVSAGRERLARLLPAAGGFVAAFSAHLLATEIQPMFPFLSTLAGLILLIPGLTLTVAMSELAHGHLVSGTARLSGALTTFLQLGLGAAIGWKLSVLVSSEAVASEAVAVPSWVPWATLPVSALAFVVLFRAHPRDYASILVGAVVAYSGSRWGSSEFGPEVGIAFGAWLLGCVSTLLARALRRPSSIPLLPGLLLLVPGSFGIRSLQALVSKDVPVGIEAAFTMSLLAMALVTGLFLANLTLRPRQL